MNVALLSSFTLLLGIDYPGGWVPGPKKEQCVDICVNSSSKPICPTKSPACLAKKQEPGDFDYLMLDQFYVPQFCRDLLQGVDSTVSHQNVNPYPVGIRCLEHLVHNELTIHGLWPEYKDGYPTCCNVSQSTTNKPFPVAGLSNEHPELLERMRQQWIDPTQSTPFDTLCEIYNHEFQKHGLCYAAAGQDYLQSAVDYFSAVLSFAEIVHEQTVQINKWAASSCASIESLAKLRALYPNRIQVFCSGCEGNKNRLLSVRTCYSQRNVPNGAITMVDCSVESAYGRFALCDEKKPISLIGYSPPMAKE